MMKVLKVTVRSERRMKDSELLTTAFMLNRAWQEYNLFKESYSNYIRTFKYNTFIRNVE